MQVRRLGRTSRAIAPIGFGGRSFAPRSAEERKRRGPGPEPREVQAALAAAIDAGVELVDTSPAWGDSEALAGATIRELRARERVVLAATVPLATEPDGTPLPADARLEHLLPAAHVQRAVEASLRATRLEVLPLAWLGPWRDGWLAASAWPELRGTMERMVHEGKVLTWGVIVDDAPGDDAATLLAQPVIAAAQLALHLHERRALPLLAVAKAREVAVIARAPLAGGTLTGALDDVPGIGRQEWRDQLGDRAEAALRWLLGHDDVTAALVGARSIDHVTAAIAAADGRALTPRLADALDRWTLA